MQEHRTSRDPQRSGPVNDKPIDSFTRGYVKKCARRLIGHHGFYDSDRDEIEQALYLKLAGHLDQANPDDPKWKAFVAKTVSRHIASLIRDRKSPKRDHRRVCSIHVIFTADEEGPVELADTLQEHETPSRRSQECRTEQEATGLRVDVAACIDRLSDQRYRELCRHLMHGTVTEAAGEMNVPRTTLNEWLPKIRQRFEELGLAGYLQIPPSDR